MNTRNVFLFFFVFCLFMTCAYAEGDPQGDASGAGIKITPCVKSLVPSWIKRQKIVKTKGFLVELNACRTSDQATECAFTVANCSGRDAWVYLDNASYLSDGKGNEYEPLVKSLGGRSVKGNDLVRTFIPSNESDGGTLVFRLLPEDIKNVDVGVILTGGEWAGGVIKGLFRKIPLNEKKPSAERTEGKGAESVQ